MRIVPPWVNHVNIAPSEKIKKTPTPKPPLDGLVFQFYSQLSRQLEQERSAQLQVPLTSAATSLVG